MTDPQFTAVSRALRYAALALVWWCALLAVEVCGQTLDECIDATCRITAADGGTGTGCIFTETDESYDIITNAHVTNTPPGGAVQVEFWCDGYQSRGVRGIVLHSWLTDQADRDIAVVRIPKSALPIEMPVIPLADEDVRLATKTINSVGCARGAWPTAWSGHVFRQSRPSVVDFVPAPAGGRSGSAIFAYVGGAMRIVGLIAWRSDDDSYGIAMHIGEIYGAFAGRQPQPYSAAEWRGRKHTPRPAATVLAKCQHAVALTQRCQHCWGRDCYPGGGGYDFYGPYGGNLYIGPDRNPDRPRGGQPDGGGEYEYGSPWFGGGEDEPEEESQPIPEQTGPESSGCDCGPKLAGLTAELAALRTALAEVEDDPAARAALRADMRIYENALADLELAEGGEINFANWATRLAAHLPESEKVALLEKQYAELLDHVDRETTIRVYLPDGTLAGESKTNIFRGGSIDFTFNPRALLDNP